MKIQNKTNPAAAQVESAKLNKAETKRGEKASAFDKLGGLGDASAVRVSDRAQMMAKAKEIASQDTIDEAKVARLQKLIDSGNYKVDSQAVADRLVDEHLLMPE